mgnify:CR=1 FL=1
MFFQFVKYFNTLRWYQKLYQENGKLPLLPYEAKKITRSDTVFILGSGSSINNISRWDIIKENDSIGFNFWMFHDFVPDFYFIESSPRMNVMDIYSQIISEKYEELKNTIFFCKPSENWNIILYLMKKYKLNYYIYHSRSWFSENTSTLKANIKKIRRKSIHKQLEFYHQGTGSLEMIVYFCAIAGYRKIILCGIDLNNSNYFYQSKKYSNYIVPNQPSDKVHKTEDTSRVWPAGMTIANVLDTYRKYLVDDDVTIYIESEMSKLAIDYPIYSLH